MQMNEAGTIWPNIIQLENGHVTSRQLRFLKCDLPEVLAENDEHSVSDSSEVVDPVVADTEVQAPRSGVKTRSMRRKAASVTNKSQRIFHAHKARLLKKLENDLPCSLGSKMSTCCRPAFLLSVYSLITSLIIIVLAVVVYQCHNISGMKNIDCGSAPVFQESNLDFLNIDVPDHTLQMEQMQMKGCDCSQMLSLMQLFEWSLFEVKTSVLLSLDFFLNDFWIWSLNSQIVPEKMGTLEEQKTRKM